jgi:hypothetical protein
MENLGRGKIAALHGGSGAGSACAAVGRVMNLSEQMLKDAISGFFRVHAFEVIPIPESNLRTPDLLVVKDLRYLVEIKAKEDDPASVEDREKILAAGEIAESGGPFAPQNTMSARIKDGIEQLDAYPVADRDLCLLWLIAVGSDATAQREQLLATPRRSRTTNA